jgi:hypothetical protein
LANALTVPHAIAAVVLCVAGLAKLRSPQPAARAFGIASGAVRVFAVGEITLGIWALVAPSVITGILLTFLYAAFAATTLVLARRGVSCGCFGAEGAASSPLQSLLSGALAALAAAGAAAGARGAGWILERPATTAAVLVLGTAAAVYAIVLAYSELPLLWRSWSPAA